MADFAAKRLVYNEMRFNGKKTRLNMGKFLLAIAILGLISSIVILIILFFKKKVSSIHNVWDLALEGNKLSKLYTIIILISFIGAVFSVFFIKMGV